MGKTYTIDCYICKRLEVGAPCEYQPKIFRPICLEAYRSIKATKSVSITYYSSWNRGCSPGAGSNVRSDEVMEDGPNPLG